MTQDRIAFFENLLKKPMAEPHKGWIEELLGAVTGRQYNAVFTDEKGVSHDLGSVKIKKGSVKVNGRQVTPEEANELLQ